MKELVTLMQNEPWQLVADGSSLLPSARVARKYAALVVKELVALLLNSATIWPLIANGSSLLQSARVATNWAALVVLELVTLLVNSAITIKRQQKMQAETKFALRDMHHIKCKVYASRKAEHKTRTEGCTGEGEVVGHPENEVGR